MHTLAHPESPGAWAPNHLHIDNRSHVSFAFSKAPKSTHNLSVDRRVFAHTRFFAHALAQIHFVVYTHVRVRPRRGTLCPSLGAQGEVSYLRGQSRGLEEKTRVSSPRLFFVSDVLSSDRGGKPEDVPARKNRGDKGQPEGHPF